MQNRGDYLKSRRTHLLQNFHSIKVIQGFAVCWFWIYFWFGAIEVFGVVVSFSLDGGTDFAGHPAPKLVVQRMRRTGESWYEVKATGDDDAVINGGPSALQNLLREKAYKFQPGYLVRILYVEDRPTKRDPSKTYKAFQDGSSEGKPFKVVGAAAAAAVPDDALDF